MKTKNKKKCFCFFKKMTLMDLFHFFLHIACQKGQLEIVQSLVEKGANIEAKDKSEKTPLHIASTRVNTDVVNYLILKGANRNV